MPAFLAAVTLAQVSASAGHPTVALLLLAMAGAGLGVLLFNLPPASIYVGDSGALLMGFILGSLVPHLYRKALARSFNDEAAGTRKQTAAPCAGFA